MRFTKQILIIFSIITLFSGINSQQNTQAKFNELANNIENKVEKEMKENTTIQDLIKKGDSEKLKEKVKEMVEKEVSKLKESEDKLRGIVDLMVQEAIKYSSKGEESIQNEMALIKKKIEAWNANGELKAMDEAMKLKITEVVNTLETEDQEILANIKCSIQFIIKEENMKKFGSSSSKDAEAFNKKQKENFDSECLLEEKIYKNFENYLEGIRNDRSEKIKKAKEEWYKKNENKKDYYNDKKINTSQDFSIVTQKNLRKDREIQTENEQTTRNRVMGIAFIFIILTVLFICFMCFKKRYQKDQEPGQGVELEIPQPYYS